MSHDYQEALFAFLLACVVIFLYQVKIKFDPPIGQMLLAWRLVYFGGFALFTTIGIFSGIGGNPENKTYIAILIGGPLILAFLSIVTGFFLYFKGSSGDAK